MSENIRNGSFRWLEKGFKTGCGWHGPVIIFDTVVDIKSILLLEFLIGPRWTVTMNDLDHTCKDPELSGDKEDFEDLEQEFPRQTPDIVIIITSIIIITSVIINIVIIIISVIIIVIARVIIIVIVKIIIVAGILGHLVAWYLSAGFMKKNLSFLLIFSS